MRIGALVFLPAAFCFAAGCGGSDVPDFPKTAAVTGTVTQGGKPVDGATVTFIPKGGAAAPSGEGGGGPYPASGTTGPDGTYTLSTFFSPAATEEGAVPGQYAVTVTKAPPAIANAPADHAAGHAESAAPKGPTNLLPKQYASADSTPLSATVAESKENVIPLEIK